MPLNYNVEIGYPILKFLSYSFFLLYYPDPNNYSSIYLVIIIKCLQSLLFFANGFPIYVLNCDPIPAIFLLFKSDKGDIYSLFKISLLLQTLTLI